MSLCGEAALGEMRSHDQLGALWCWLREAALGKVSSRDPWAASVQAERGGSWQHERCMISITEANRIQSVSYLGSYLAWAAPGAGSAACAFWVHHALPLLLRLVEPTPVGDASPSQHAAAATAAAVRSDVSPAAGHAEPAICELAVSLVAELAAAADGPRIGKRLSEARGPAADGRSFAVTCQAEPLCTLRTLRDWASGQDAALRAVAHAVHGAAEVAGVDIAFRGS
jgi:hypothetical protein